LALSQKMPKVKFDDKTIEKAKKRHEKHIKNKKR
jgi:monofunctional biosynthetic peptidoglycan transglycosylase